MLCSQAHAGSIRFTSMKIPDYEKSKQIKNIHVSVKKVYVTVYFCAVDHHTKK